ncbi:MAG: hypothetical protein A2Z49_07565 [Chloroflexi bacterium RBG_19FT_COMBO_56_12]|nr:MAG: hypothetical protein A2Z49_07565 [Chloroflexi bacterium RBG_19FT_COMBO_56_12]
MDASPLEIITLSPHEWQSYRQLRLESLQESPQAFGSPYKDQVAKPDSYWQSRLADAAKGEQSWLLFARAGGQLLGMIGAFRDEVDDPSAADQAAVISVYVTPTWRGRGISSLLMQTILDVLKENGIRLAHLGVNLDQAAALHLYQRFGFNIVSTVTHPMGDGIDHDEYLMEKLL